MSYLRGPGDDGGRLKRFVGPILFPSSLEIEPATVGLDENPTLLCLVVQKGFSRFARTNGVSVAYRYNLVIPSWGLMGGATPGQQ
jgi:hypothetical protein